MSFAWRLGRFWCVHCGARWGKWADNFVTWWSLDSPKCGKCCDNVAMGPQILEAQVNGTIVPTNDRLKEMHEAAGRLGWEPKGEVNIHVRIQFGWLDRLRILLGREVRLLASAKCQIDPGLTSPNETYVSVEKLFPEKSFVHEVSPGDGAPPADRRTP